MQTEWEGQEGQLQEDLAIQVRLTHMRKRGITAGEEHFSVSGAAAARGDGERLALLGGWRTDGAELSTEGAEPLCRDRGRQKVERSAQYSVK